MSSAEWTTRDLELYHDGELDPARRETLSADLRGDHRLRARLAEIVRLDELTTRALGPDHGAAAAPARRSRRVLPPALAAGIGVLIIIAAAWLARARFASTPAPETVVDAPRAPAADPYTPVRVVLSIPTGPRDADKPPAPREPQEPGVATSAPAQPTDAFTAALADERVTRSVTTAAAFLEDLPTERQLQVCRQWVEHPHLRRITFLRLERLQLQPAVADAVRRLVRDLATQPEFEPWLRSHHLVDAAPAPAPRSPRGSL